MSRELVRVGGRFLSAAVPDGWSRAAMVATAAFQLGVHAGPVVDRLAHRPRQEVRAPTTCGPYVSGPYGER